jgi:hypothetical protein
MSDFKIGDEIFHKSNPTIKWIIERINETEIYCSTLMKETLEHKKEVFTVTSIEKCAKTTITVVKKSRDNYW